MSLFTAPDETLHFINEMPIELSYRTAVEYKNTNTYDHKMMTKGFVWHRICVMHKNLMRKPQILESLFEAVKGEEFFPIAYKEGFGMDKFLVRQCQPAFDKLFKQNLQIRGPDNKKISIAVMLNAGEYKNGQISAYAKIGRALDDLYGRLQTVNDERGILNLTRFALHQEFRDVVVNLGNTAVFQRVCDIIFRNEIKFRDIHGFLMSHNGIISLQPLKVFSGCDFAILDLSNNEIRSGARVCVELKEIKADELRLAENPITRADGYPSSLRGIFSNFKKLDGIPIANLSKDYTPLDYEVDVNCDGLRIDEINKDELQKYENVDEWHGIVFCDQEEIYTKDRIFSAFFSAISPTLSEVYPCYYKFSSGEHKFLVRRCFDQLKWLVDKCKFELEVPRNTPSDELHRNGEDDDDQDQPKIVFYLRLCVGAFQSGQVEPLNAIEKAITRCYSAMDRLLNLDNFQSTRGLENVIINLSSTKILNRIITQAARKYMSNISELRLGNNKITSAKFAKPLAFMSNLKVLDLSCNALQSIDDIKELEKLSIKSLILDGNPLCRHYAFPATYVKDVKNLFPEITKLDNIDIANQGMLCTQKNYLSDLSAYDLVEQFVSGYFMTFESAVLRLQLKEMYHPKAIFSMICQYAGGKINPQNSKRFIRYTTLSRNIMKMADFTRAFTSLHIGPDEICEAFMALPGMQFDMFTLKTDTHVIKACHNITVITVSGVFLDQAKSILDTDLMFAFTRTFVLTPVQMNIGPLKCATEYQIVNDQFTVLNPTVMQQRNSFKHFQSNVAPKEEEITATDKESLLVMFQEITQLKSIWCTRCLEESSWNFEAGLQNFIELSQDKKIPDTAFISDMAT